MEDGWGGSIELRAAAMASHVAASRAIAAAWSACDAWVFGSLSLDGRVVLNHVPSTEKYKILL